MPRERRVSTCDAQDYELLAPSIDVFTPLIYAEKSGRSPDWGRTYLEQSGEFVPPGRRAQLILDYLDFPASLALTADSEVSTWGVQVFGGAPLFEDEHARRLFRSAVEAITAKAADTAPS